VSFHFVLLCILTTVCWGVFFLGTIWRQEYHPVFLYSATKLHMVMHKFSGVRGRENIK